MRQETRRRHGATSSNCTTTPHPCWWPELDQTLESPHHNQTIRSSAKIAELLATSRRQRKQSEQQQRSSSSSSSTTTTTMINKQHRTTSSKTDGESIRHTTQRRHCRAIRQQQQQQLLLHGRHRATGANWLVISMLTLGLFLVTTSTLLTASGQQVLASDNTRPISDPSGGGAAASVAAAIETQQVAKAEALVSGQKNVILIKYANVSQAKDQGDESAAAASSRLQVYQLHEPLSVSVIESKFSHSIQLFDVSQNQLATLPKDLFCPLSNEVRQLNASHNLLENFDSLGLISQAGQLCLGDLRVLDMSHNLIKHLPATGIASLHNLEVLSLSHNLIETLDELSLSTLFKLTRLDLSHNRIQQLPARIFHKSTAMQVLRLHHNQLATPINQLLLTGLSSLEELTLNRNNISHVLDAAFADKPNLRRVDLRENQLKRLGHEALRVDLAQNSRAPPSTAAQSAPPSSPPVFKPRLHHNGQYAGLAQVSPATSGANHQLATAEFLLSSNPFVCDCQLDWMRKMRPSHRPPTAASRFRAAASSIEADLLQNDQPVISPTTSASLSEGSTMATTNAQQQQQSNSENSLQQQTSNYGRIVDLELIRCSPLFRRNAQLRSQRHRAPSDGAHGNLAVQLHHANNHLHHHHHSHPIVKPSQPSTSLSFNNELLHAVAAAATDTIDLLTSDSSNFLCRYKSHCFALCHCCEFDACDCEMICPAGCNCYYDSSWQTNIIDCSANNHTVVPDRIPMDVSGLYLDGNDITSLKPSNLIARKSLKTLYLNSSNLQFIANRTFNGLIELQTLYLNDNHLRSLQGYEFEPLAQLRALYLQSNRLDHINNQTFIYLRSLEQLDLSNNRLTSFNMDLFMSVALYNIRIRQLSIAHNWWSCQCQAVQQLRQILKEKFISGGVNIADRNQLRCYYNSTTVGPLILEGSAGVALLSAAAANDVQRAPLFGSFLSPSSTSGGALAASSSNNRQQQQQQQLTEINQCSDMLDEQNPFGLQLDLNPPIIHPPQVAPELPSDFTQTGGGAGDLPQVPNELPSANDQPQPPLMTNYPHQNQFQLPAGYGEITRPQPGGGGGNFIAPYPDAPVRVVQSPSVTSFVFVSVLLVCALVVALAIFIFRQQQQRYHNPHKKSSAASTISVSSSASSTGLPAGAKFGHHHHQQQRTLNHSLEHHHHRQPPPASAHFGAHSHTLHSAAAGAAHHLILGAGPQVIHSHHQHSASSQSNIYAALVSPTTGSSTIVTTNHQNQPQNLYSNSSSAGSHHSSGAGSSSNQQQQQLVNGQRLGYPATNRWQHQQALYGAPLHHQQQQQQPLYGAHPAEGSPYAMNASAGSYKTCASLYNGVPASSSSPAPLGDKQDWAGGMRLPRMKQLVSRFLNKSLALGGLRTGGARESLASAVASDKIYDAFLSYDKRDEPFVLQHLSAELEYGLQYRVADRYRDLPLPTSAYMGEAISSVIGCSHRTIVVISEHFLTSDWCRFELQAALRESALDKSHKIIAVVLDPNCLLEMDAEMRSLLLTNQLGNQQQQQQQQLYQQPQLVQLADGSNSPPAADFQQQQQLVATLSNGGQVCTQTAASSGQSASKISFVNYNERKFWPKLKQLMPAARPTAQTLTLTTKN